MDTKVRNYLLLQLFKKNGFKAVRLTGNPNIPAVILFENLVISCYCRGDEVYFTDKPKEGKIVFTVHLDESLDDLRPVLLNILDQYEHRTCYRIELVEGNLLEPLKEFYKEDKVFLKDYYFDPRTKSKFPVFLPGKDVKLYFEKKNAEEAVSKILKLVPSIKLKIV